MADEAYISQVVNEAVAARDGLGDAYVSQVVHETVAAANPVPSSDARISQVVLELLTPANELQVSQVVLEVVAAATGLPPSSVDATRPLEALAIHMGTGRYTMITDVFPRHYHTGIDPETGLPTLFYVDTRGVIFSPDWSLHEGSPTGHYYNMIGSSTLVTDVVSIAGGSLASMTITTTAATLPVGGDTFKYGYPCMVYVARPQTLVPPDTTNRYEIVAIGQATSNTTDTLTVDFTAPGSQVFYAATAGTLAAATSSWRVFIAPSVMSVWLPPLRDDPNPTLDDRIDMETLGVQVGWSTDFALPISGIDHADDGPIFVHALVMESKGYWPFDVPLGSGSNDGFPTSYPAAANTDTPRSVPLDPNLDNCWTTCRFAGHIVIPNLLQLGVTQNWDVELLGCVSKGIIEKGASGVNPA